MPSDKQPFSLVKPTEHRLSAYVDALERGWSPDNVRGAAATQEQLHLIAENPAVFLSRFDDEDAKGPPVQLPDGTTATRLPGIARWMWDGEFCGSIGFRWQPGTAGLPPHVLGHIGFAVVPWKQRQGFATRAMGLLLPTARSRGLEFVEITTDPENIASQKVIEANGGNLVEHFKKPPALGGGQALRYRVPL